MNVLVSTSTDAFYNLALEEVLVKHSGVVQNSLLLIYRNDTSVVLGKNQNIFKEVNYPYCIDNKIMIARRLSGGGTVIHDMGNINFAFIEPYDLKKVNNYDSSVGRLTKALQKLNIDCKMNDRNAIVLSNNDKISGCAQFSSPKGILSHCTLLYDSDLSTFSKILSKKNYQVEVKSSESVPSPIQNIKTYIEKDIDKFIEMVVKCMGLDYSNNSTFTSDQLNKTKELRDQKYRQVEYIYDTCNTCVIEKKSEFIKLDKGKITNLKIEGLKDDDYIGKRLILSEIEINNPIWNWMKTS